MVCIQHLKTPCFGKEICIDLFLTTITENNYFGCKGVLMLFFPFFKHTFWVTVINAIKNT